jgi:hypothetical protein
MKGRGVEPRPVMARAECGSRLVIDGIGLRRPTAGA